MIKRLIAFTLTILMLTSSFSFLVQGENANLIGDINGDGEIDKYDYIYCKRAVLNTITLNDVQTEAADVNGDGKINSYDYILIKRHVLKTYVIEQPELAPEPTYVPNVISAGKQYTYSVAPSSSYSDSYNCEMTDGIYDVSTNYYAGGFSGFNNTTDIIVDLCEDGKNINKFELSYLSVNEAGINIPRSITVSGSNDNKNWNSLGNMTIPAYKAHSVMRASLELGNDVEYRYIRFTVVRTSAWVFIDEVFVYSSIPKMIIGEGGAVTESYLNDRDSDSVIVSNLKKVTTGKATDVTLGKTLVSRDCKYTVDCKDYDWRSGESSTLLTDGAITGAPFELKEWVGISSADTATVTVDLGKVRNDVFAFELHCFNRSATSINLPIYCDISVSTDGKTFTKLRRLYSQNCDQENYAFVLALSELISARYVRFTLAKGSGYCWIEEAAVYSNYYEEYVTEPLYGSFDFETTDVLKYWSSGDSDYNKITNLLQGLDCQITVDTYVDAETGEKNNYPEDSGLLTDGVTTEDQHCYNGIWHQFNGAGGRNVYFDLGAVTTVYDFSMRLLKKVGWAIYLPESVTLILSENGKDWYKAGSVSPVLSANDGITTAKIDLDKGYRARYILVRFDTVSHVFTDEMTITARKNVSGASSLTSLPKYKFPDPEVSNENYMVSSEEILGGVEDVCLMYHTGGVMDEEFMLPYVAYVDTNGNIKDTMFDGFLFLPTTGQLPSGGHPYGTSIASDWNYLFDELFTSGKNLDALNKTADKVNKALGKNEKLKVYFTIPHMDDTLVEFGDIDFDGKNDSLTSLSNRVYVAKYYAQRLINEFNSRNYENLELCGFYWFHESISGGDVETSKAVNKMFDEIGYQLFWIPYFNASGYSRWEEFGFDVGCLQPNYAFSLEVPESRLKNASDLAKRYGMCVEMEIDAAAIHDIRYFKKYMNYLYYGKEYRYMDEAIHMYYQGVDYFGISAMSEKARLRLIYEYTYQFMKGTLKTLPDSVSKLTFSSKKNTPYKNTLNKNDAE
ncbi:MAG: DUF4855 domain-containing protein, partial [Clostridia bacterium]|nr:DUF4855 domain-containing protein [Clostridia bacterium]